MARIISIVILLLCSFVAESQMGYLFVKKGFHKKKIYVEEDRITLELQSGIIYRGLITLLKDDTIFVNGKPVPIPSVKSVILYSGYHKIFSCKQRRIVIDHRRYCADHGRIIIK